MPFVDWLSDEVNEQLDTIERTHGEAAMARVRRFLDNPNDPALRFPYQKTQSESSEGVKYIFPEISNRGWQDLYAYPDLGPAIRQLEGSFTAIRDEYDAVLRAKTLAAQPYTADLRDTPYAEGWKYIFLHRYGGPTPEAKHFPVTLSTVFEVLGKHLYSMTMLHFAVLDPGTRIARHSDYSNLTLTVHLAIDIPENCRICVEDEWRDWHEGKCLGFDHSFEHEVFNDSPRARVCLLMDVWNPAVTLPERQALALVFKEIHEAYAEP